MVFINKIAIIFSVFCRSKVSLESVAAWRGCELRNRLFSTKIIFLAERKREFTTKFAILPNGCYAFVLLFFTDTAFLSQHLTNFHF